MRTQMVFHLACYKVRRFYLMYCRRNRRFLLAVCIDRGRRSHENTCVLIN